MNKKIAITTIFIIYIIVIGLVTASLQQNFIKIKQGQSGPEVLVSQVLMPKEGYVRILNSKNSLKFVSDLGILGPGVYQNLTVKIPTNSFVPNGRYKAYLYDSKTNSPQRDLMGRMIETDINLQ